MLYSRLRTIWSAYTDARQLAKDSARKSEYRLVVDLCIMALLRIFIYPRKGRIAVIRLDNIGDFVLWLEGARAIRRRYPSPHYALTLVAPFTLGEFAFASGIFDNVYPVHFDRLLKSRGYRRRTFGALGAKGFSVAINPTYSRNFWVDDCVTLSTLAPQRIGHRGDLANNRQYLNDITSNWYTDLFPSQSPDAHEIERNWAFARMFDPSLPMAMPKLPRGMLRLPDWLSGEEPYFVLCTGASLPFKQWPVSGFAEIARRLCEKTGWKAIVCGSTDDVGRGNQIVKASASSRVENAAGKTSLAEFAGVIAGSRLVITNDSGGVHIAAATGTPAVCVAGGGHYRRYLPYPRSEPIQSRIETADHVMPCFNCHWNCVYPIAAGEAVPCIERVGVEDVWLKVLTILKTADSAIERPEGRPP